MRRNSGVILIGIALATLMFAGCKGSKIPAFWAGEQIVIDGKMEDWADLPGTFADKLSTIIMLKNDNDNIYFLVMFSDVQKLSLALRNGFTVWVDKSGKKQKNFGYRFVSDRQRMGRERSEMRQRGTSGRDSDQKRPEIQMPITGNLYVISNEDDPGVPVNSQVQANAAVKFGNCDGIWVCEMKIPLEPATFLPNSVKLKPGDALTFGLQIKSSEMDKKQGDRSADRGMGESGDMGGAPPMGGGEMGGRGGGGGGGGGKFGGRGDFQNTGKGGEVWLKTTLAVESSGLGK